MKLTKELTTALIAVFAIHGRSTKSVIRECWMDGRYNSRGIGEYESELQQWRNSRSGHSQLDAVSLKKLCEKTMPLPPVEFAIINSSIGGTWFDLDDGDSSYVYKTANRGQENDQVEARRIKSAFRINYPEGLYSVTIDTSEKLVSVTINKPRAR